MPCKKTISWLSIYSKDKQYTVKGTKTGCSHCKCEWNTINKTSKYAHFGSKEIAKRCKVAWCSEEYSRFPSDEKSIIISHFEDLKAKAEAKERHDRRKGNYLILKLGLLNVQAILDPIQSLKKSKKI